MADTLGAFVRQVRNQLGADRYEPLNDRELLDLYQHEHDETAFATLVGRHQRRVHGTLARVLADPADIDDAFQATFLVLLRKAGTVTWQTGLGPWLSAVAHRLAVHAKGKASIRLAREADASPREEPTAPAPDMTWRDACALVHEELDRLPDKFRLPLLLCYLEGKSRDEAAKQLGIKGGAVKGRLERGRNLLRDRLLRRGVTLTAGLLTALTHSPARAASLELVQTTVAAMAAPSARVLALVQGVTATMVLSKFKFTASLLLLTGVLAGLIGAASPGRLTPEAAVASAASPDKGDAIAGKVIDAKGAPVAGAKIALWTKKDRTQPLTTTDADGRFSVSVSQAQRDNNGVLVVQAKGTGADWLVLKEPIAGELTFQLDDVPIQGKILDLEGKPIAGVAVTVREVGKSKTANLDPFIDAYAKLNSGVGIPRLHMVPTEALDAARKSTTDKDGKFRLTGFGPERYVEVMFTGKGIETQWVTVITRPGIKPTAYGFRGPAFDLLVGPGKEMAGVVTEKGTGKPVAGARVMSQRSQTTTDEKGQYRLEGLTKSKEYYVWAQGPMHFQTLTQVNDTPGREAITTNFQVAAGVHVEGTLRDKQTGKPVSGTLQYDVNLKNPNLKAYDFAQNASIGHAEAGADGKFRILVIPGKGYLSAKADTNIYTRATPDKWDGSLIMAAPHPVFPYYHHAITTIDVDPKNPETLKCDITFDQGETRKGTVVDADGKPVAGVIAFGLTAVPDPGARTFPRQPRYGPLPPDRLADGTFTVVGLDPKQPRHLAFVHPERKLGKIVKVSVDDKELVVKLEPLGSVTGVVKQDDGTPAADRKVTLQPPRRFAFYRDYPIELLHNNQSERQRTGRVIKWLPDAVKTDAAGKFRIDGVLPGLSLEAWAANAEGDRNAPTHMHGGVRVEAGKTKELGELKRGY